MNLIFSEAENKKENKKNSDKSIDISISPYIGKNTTVKLIRSFINTYLDDYLLECMVHGSLGTYEEINYSDFDGLVIIRNEVINNKARLLKVCYYLNQSLKIIYKFDPLQHHGWFLLTEADLDNYPNDYFPLELFEYSKSIYSNGQAIKIVMNDNLNYKKGFIDLSSSIKKKIDKLRTSNNELKSLNIYQLKGLLSQIMLLPSLYLQAKNSKGIFKKFSFDELRKEFGNKYFVMDTISSLRLAWNYKLNAVQKFMLTSNKYLIRRLGIKIAPVDRTLLRRIHQEIHIDDIKELIETMERKIKLE
ncbi:MAG: hypothetical protein H6609_19030 [Ignavibacteriales bacterium]|nr:hypothetical protein [Ignavibacteriales bacterium]